MILENEVVKILEEEMPTAFSQIQWSGMYDKAASRIVKKIKDKLVEY